VKKVPEILPLATQTIVEIDRMADGKFSLWIWVEGEMVKEERTERFYSSESDAIVSARHAISNFRKSKGTKP